jgi:hypothetical protein
VAYTGPQRDSAAVCSVPNIERLEQMLDEAGFARLVLTAESERTDGVVQSRPIIEQRITEFPNEAAHRDPLVHVISRTSDGSKIPAANPRSM